MGTVWDRIKWAIGIVSELSPSAWTLLVILIGKTCEHPVRSVSLSVSDLSLLLGSRREGKGCADDEAIAAAAAELTEAGYLVRSTSTLGAVTEWKLLYPWSPNFKGGGAWVPLSPNDCSPALEWASAQKAVVNLLACSGANHPGPWDAQAYARLCAAADAFGQVGHLLTIKELSDLLGRHRSNVISALDALQAAGALTYSCDKTRRPMLFRVDLRVAETVKSVDMKHEDQRSSGFEHPRTRIQYLETDVLFEKVWAGPTEDTLLDCIERFEQVKGRDILDEERTEEFVKPLIYIQELYKDSPAIVKQALDRLHSNTYADIRSPGGLLVHFAKELAGVSA